MSKIELDNMDLEKVAGGALDATLPLGASVGTLTSTKTGKTYSFKAENLDHINEVVLRTGMKEVDKVQYMLDNHWIY